MTATAPLALSPADPNYSSVYRYMVVGHELLTIHGETLRVVYVDVNRADGGVSVMAVKQTKKGTDFKRNGWMWLTVEHSLRKLADRNPGWGELADRVEAALRAIADDPADDTLHRVLDGAALDRMVIKSDSRLVAASDYAALDGSGATEAHARYCREHGHATHTVDGVVQPHCPRCGEDRAPEDAELVADWSGALLRGRASELASADRLLEVDGVPVGPRGDDPAEHGLLVEQATHTECGTFGPSTKATVWGTTLMLDLEMDADTPVLYRKS